MLLAHCDYIIDQSCFKSIETRWCAALTIGMFLKLSHSRKIEILECSKVSAHFRGWKPWMKSFHSENLNTKSVSNTLFFEGDITHTPHNAFFVCKAPL